jgi:deoxyribose-phosphate aldolase
MSSYEYLPQNEPSLDDIRSEVLIEKDPGSFKLIFSLVDLTTLNTDDTESRVKLMCEKMNEFPDQFPGYPLVGAICVYPLLVPVVHKNLIEKQVNIASVAAGFPSSQTFPEVKEIESRMAVAAGANEIDIVISAGKFLNNEFDYVSAEIRQIKKVIGDAKLKVILETGLLPDPSAIYRASMISMESGADFIKTSTGKIQPAATPEAVLVMCHAIKDFWEKTGRKVGIKPAGGISTTEHALEYASIVKGVLGDEWLDQVLFRIGASRLANNLLSEIFSMETGKPQKVSYF